LSLDIDLQDCSFNNKLHLYENPNIKDEMYNNIYFTHTYDIDKNILEKESFFLRVYNYDHLNLLINKMNLKLETKIKKKYLLKKLEELKKDATNFMFHYKYYNEKCDVWSCGVILYILLTARPPFNGRDDNEILEKIKKGQFDLEIKPLDKISKEAKDLITSLLEYDPSKRISAEQALNHEWFKNHQIKEQLNSLRNKKRKYIENLKSYKNQNILQTVTLAYLVHNFYNFKEIKKATKIFNLIDKDGDGRINKEELYNHLLNLSSSSSSQDDQIYKKADLVEDVNKIFREIDSNENGFIDCEEFVRASIDKQKFLHEDLLKYAFKFFDKDDSGQIDRDELKKVLFAGKFNSEEQTKEQLDSIISEVDTNSDGRISYQEFCVMMNNILNI
jgi:calcium-dependent protein kinase